MLVQVHGGDANPGGARPQRVYVCTAHDTLRYMPLRLTAGPAKSARKERTEV